MANNDNWRPGARRISDLYGAEPVTYASGTETPTADVLDAAFFAGPLPEVESEAECRRLWRGVLTQGLQDALSLKDDDLGDDLSDALLWPRMECLDFVLTCEYAGLEAAEVLRQFNDYQERQSCE